MSKIDFERKFLTIIWRQKRMDSVCLLAWYILTYRTVIIITDNSASQRPAGQRDGGGHKKPPRCFIGLITSKYYTLPARFID
jgi:hypothetical protein